jgi:A/G-specific adenine glycosylase
MMAEIKSMPESTRKSVATGPIQEFRDALLAWYGHSGRDLPWRHHEGDAYRVIVSELMLVQTTVSAVIPYYHRFLERFPTVADLAAADEADVLKQWEGLGYYRRARHLHSLARAVVQDHGGQFPRDEAGLLALPGVGRYIAGAVRSFAFNQPAPILEANTIRLIARLIGLTETVEQTASQKRLWAQAAERVDPARPGDFNQAMMDLGATICTPKEPRCLICPVQAFCKAAEVGIAETIPVRAAKAPPKLGEELALIITRPTDGTILMMNRTDKGLWANFWELPTFTTGGADPARRADAGFACQCHADLNGLVEAILGLSIAEARPLGEKPIRYGVTTHKMTLHLYQADLKGPASSPPITPSGWCRAEFLRADQLALCTLSTAQRQALARWGS